jgi:hypothetical protein
MSFPIKPVPVVTTPTLPVEVSCKYTEAEAAQMAQEMKAILTRSEWVSFLKLLRCIFVQLVRWIERHYPEAVD